MCEEYFKALRRQYVLWYIRHNILHVVDESFCVHQIHRVRDASLEDAPAEQYPIRARCAR